MIVQSGAHKHSLHPDNEFLTSPLRLAASAPGAFPTFSRLYDAQLTYMLLSDHTVRPLQKNTNDVWNESTKFFLGLRAESSQHLRSLSPFTGQHEDLIQYQRWWKYTRRGGAGQWPPSTDAVHPQQMRIRAGSYHHHLHGKIRNTFFCLAVSCKHFLSVHSSSVLI